MDGAAAPPIDVDAERFRLAEKLTTLAAASGDPRFSRAAGMLRAEPGGRPTMDDTQALADMRALIETGRKPRDAARMVAKALAEDTCLDSTVRRLLRKIFGH